MDLIGPIGPTEVRPCYKAFENEAKHEFFTKL
jgi:hypothetical protein